MPDAHVPNTITGRDAFLRVLKDEGVTRMFGNPGTTELPIMHALSSAPEMGYVLALQEAVVIAMADGYARISGRIGIVAAQNGPAATLLVPPLAEAMKASVPILALVQDVESRMADRNAFQEIDHHQLFADDWPRRHLGDHHRHQF